MSTAWDLTTPIGVEQAMTRLITSLTQAQRELATARDKAVEDEMNYRAARRRAMFANGCPKVGRGEGMVTVDERDAWVDAQVENEERRYKLAEAARDAAQDKMRILRDDVSLLVTLSASVRQAYAVAGHGEVAV